MSLSVTTANIEPGILLLHLAGHITIGPETDNLEWLLRNLLREGQTKLILDLAGVDLIDPDAALFLVRCFFAARGSGAELRFAAAKPDVFRPFRATMLDTLLSFDPTVTASCQHFTRAKASG
jgi:anti-anti-sigma factor